MADTLALEHLYTEVVARFTAEGTTAVQTFGWREPAHQLLAPQRIVWVPGNPSGSVGAIKGARFPGQNPRPLHTLDELFHVLVSAQDATQPEDELAQYRAARFLFDDWLRAVYLAAHGVVRVEALNWVLDKNERRHGATILAVCGIEAMIPDTVAGSAPVDTKAVIDTTLLDVTEQEEITP